MKSFAYSVVRLRLTGRLVFIAAVVSNQDRHGRVSKRSLGIWRKFFKCSIDQTVQGRTGSQDFEKESVKFSIFQRRLCEVS
jgi:hypothetical protein